MFQILQRHGWSQRRIANAVRMSQSEVSEILAGRRVVSYDVLVRIAAGLGAFRVAGWGWLMPTPTPPAAVTTPY